MVEFVVKRDGRTVKFNKQLIVRAIEKADVPRDVAEKIADEISARKSTILSVEDIQDLVEKKLMRSSYTKEAQNYVRFRYRKELLRESEALNESLLDIIENKNEAVSEENSNKNSLVLSTQRDYMAGEVSKYLSKRFFLDPDVVEAHNKEIIHVHDLDYFAQHLFNCCLVNLEDVLQNGTVINKTFISKPHSFSTACNIATQVMAAVSSNQLGGQSESLAHLAPFVDESRKRIRLKVEKELEEFKTILSPELWRDKVEDITETRVKDEVKRGVQTIQYQINTLMTTNGQTPFVTLFMYLNEAKNEREKKDLALIIEEVLKQRIQGIQNEKGQWVTASFPKLVYVLDENNIHPDSEYYYLTKLSAECSAKRLVPDYVSAKKMKELKVTDDGAGHVFPPMGCVDGKEVITYKYKDVLYVTSFTRAWHRLAQEFNVKEQSAEGNYYIDLTDVEIYDSSSNGFVECKRIIKNKDKGDWIKITFSNGRCLLCTEDHPLPIINKGRTFARDLEYGDSIHIDTTQYSESNVEIPTPEALELGISDTTDIPSKVFTFTDKSKRDFFEGVYISKGNLNPRENTLNFKTPTKEYALQLMCLVQSMGMYAEVDNTKVKVYPTKERAEYLRVHEGINFADYYEPPTTARVVNIQKLGSIGKPSYDVTTASDRFSVSGVQSHNCRSFLSPYLDENGKAKFYGRFNCGVCTINLPHAALTAVEQAKETGEDLFDVFWKVLDERLLLCKRALISRYERLRGTPSDVSPTHWQGGAIARLDVGETIDKFLKGGYSTISLGYAGIYETVMALIGKSHTTDEGKRLAKDIMQVLNDRCDEWKEETGLGFSVYGAPIESTTYAFSKALQRDFGKIKDISDHGYVTNSYHICVRENIDAFSKLAIEAEFQPLSSGGMISYVESGNMANNIPAVLELLKFMYENITYAEINTKSDYCQVCGYSKEIPVIKDEETNEYIWKCPNCGNSDKRKLNIARRTCGYIGSNFWNKGRTEEIKERVVHIG